MPKNSNIEQSNNTINVNELLSELAIMRDHSIKSNAYTLEQNTFGEKVHKIEEKIKKLREQEAVSFNDMINLAQDIEKLSLLKENFRDTREKIKSHKLNEKFDGDDKIQIKLADNGRGFDYKKIAEKAIKLKLCFYIEHKGV